MPVHSTPVKQQQKKKIHEKDEFITCNYQYEDYILKYYCFFVVPTHFMPGQNTWEMC